jgi:hypothetical protein
MPEIPYDGGSFRGSVFFRTDITIQRSVGGCKPSDVVIQCFLLIETNYAFRIVTPIIHFLFDILARG